MRLFYCIFPSRALLYQIGSMKLISGVLIEGWRWSRSKKNPDVERDSRVTHYSSEFSPDGRLWTVIKDENGLPRVRDIIPCPLSSILPVLNLAFCSMKRLRLLLVPSPLSDGMLVQRTVSSVFCGQIISALIGCLLHHAQFMRLGGERGCVRVKCFAQQHSTMISKYMALKLPFYSACCSNS